MKYSTSNVLLLYGWGRGTLKGTRDGSLDRLYYYSMDRDEGRKKGRGTVPQIEFLQEFVPRPTSLVPITI